MRAADAKPGDILQGIEGVYLRDIELGRGAAHEMVGFSPNPPTRALVSHRWMAWFTEGGYKPGGEDVLVYVGHRWIYKRDGTKRRKKIIREVLFRGRTCWVDPTVWRYLEKVEEGTEELNTT